MLAKFSGDRVSMAMQQLYASGGFSWPPSALCTLHTVTTVVGRCPDLQRLFGGMVPVEAEGLLEALKLVLLYLQQCHQVLCRRRWSDPCWSLCSPPSQGARIGTPRAGSLKAPPTFPTFSYHSWGPSSARLRDLSRSQRCQNLGQSPGDTPCSFWQRRSGPRTLFIVALQPARPSAGLLGFSVWLALRSTRDEPYPPCVSRPSAQWYNSLLDHGGGTAHSSRTSFRRVRLLLPRGLPESGLVSRCAFKVGVCAGSLPCQSCVALTLFSFAAPVA